MDTQLAKIVVTTDITDIEPELSARQKILQLEQRINALDDSRKITADDCPLVHHFAPGMYGREIHIPQGSLIVGKIHKHAHLNMLLQGRVTVFTESGIEEIVAPKVMVSQAGTKRALYAHEDLIWVTVHLNADDGQDLDVIEDYVIAKTYTDYDEFVKLDSQRLLPKE